MAPQWKVVLWSLGGLSFLCFFGYVAFPATLRCQVWLHGEPTYNDILTLRDSTALGILSQLSNRCGQALVVVLPAFVPCGVGVVVGSRRK